MIAFAVALPMAGWWSGACGAPADSTAVPPVATSTTTVSSEAGHVIESSTSGRTSVRTSGGTVEAASRDGELEVTAVTAAEGWRISERSGDHRHFLVRFVRGQDSVEVTLEATPTGLRQSTVQRTGSES